MTIYKILPYTYKKAKQLGLTVFPSDNPKYKIEIYDEETGAFLYYGGNPKYSDYPHYIQSHGKQYADNRRRLYRIRHSKEIANKGSRGWVINKLLW
jgi:hypothetical protein